jgi:hypothetical protein
MKLRILLVLLLIFATCKKQTNSDDLSQISQRSPNIEIQIEGKPQKGFLIGFEPFLIKDDYQTEDTFYRILKAYFDYAKKEEVIAVERTIVVMPEYIGTWLVASGEKFSLFEKHTISEAMEELVLNHLGRFLWVFLFEQGHATDRLKETLFRMKAFQMAEAYQNVFSRLAKEYRVDIVAGSIVLPEPKVVEGKITITDGPLQNVSFYFHSDGSVDPQITRKVFLIEEEKEFLAEKKSFENPVFNTPLGILNTMICADSWYPEAYQKALENSAEIIAIPSLVSPPEAWDQKWMGYNGQDTPKDVSVSDVKHITEWQAWKKYSVIGRASKYKIATAMNVFFRGRIWDINASGSAFILRQGKQVNVMRKKDNDLGMIYAIGL